MGRKGFSAIEWVPNSMYQVIAAVIAVGIIGGMFFNASDAFAGTGDGTGDVVKDIEFGEVNPGAGSQLCQQLSGSHTALATEQNIGTLAVIIATESSIYTNVESDEEIAVGYTVLNRMVEQGTQTVEDVATGYQGWNEWSGEKPSDDYYRLANEILQCSRQDITSGANYYYSPISMPKESAEISNCQHMEYMKCAVKSDIVPGLTDSEETDFITEFGTGPLLESVEGIEKNGEPVKNYQPSWANERFLEQNIRQEWKDMFADDGLEAVEPFERICIPNVPEKRFKFYKIPVPEEESGEKDC